jgi:predicted NBD/HSP70 family sugar kinase
LIDGQGVRAFTDDPGGPVVAGSAGDLLRLIRGGRAATRADLADLTGLATTTIAKRVDSLIAARLIYDAGEGASTGGRPPRLLEFNKDAGVVLVADLGATHSRVAVTDLAGIVLAEVASGIEIARGPDAVLDWVDDCFREVLERAGRSLGDVRGIGMGVPGPVEFEAGRPVSPPIMPGWDRYRVVERLVGAYGVPALLDNDVNIMGLGEYYTNWSEYRDLLYVKVGTGIGCGIVAGGQLLRGASGAAGDIGHIHVAGHDDARCTCGNYGCLEAVAGGGALARQLRERGVEAHDSRSVVRLVRASNPDALELVRQAGRLLGEVLAGLVNAFNPAVIVIGGDVAQAREPLFAGVREAVYLRSTPLATESLRIERSQLDDRAGVTGAAVMVIEHILSPAVVDTQVASAV